MLFYLILRGLDTVEDDMTIPIEKKDKMLREFHTYLDTPGWNFTESKQPAGRRVMVGGPNEADRQLLVEFEVVIKEFGEINENYRVVIKDITKRMGNGMADYANNAAHNLYGVDTLADFDMYCYYVAGLVGEGLTRLFIASGKENPKLTEAHDLYLFSLELLMVVPMQWVYFYRRRISYGITGKILMTNEDSGLKKYGRNTQTI